MLFAHCFPSAGLLEAAEPVGELILRLMRGSAGRHEKQCSNDDRSARRAMPVHTGAPPTLGVLAIVDRWRAWQGGAVRADLDLGKIVDGARCKRLQLFGLAPVMPEDGCSTVKTKTKGWLSRCSTGRHG